MVEKRLGQKMALKKQITCQGKVIGIRYEQ